MKQVLLLCDRCGAKHAETIQVFIDRRMGAAGSMDDEYDSVDLCAACMAMELTLLMDGKGNVQGHHRHGREWVEKMKVAKHKSHD